MRVYFPKLSNTRGGRVIFLYSPARVVKLKKKKINVSPPLRRYVTFFASPRREIRHFVNNNDFVCKSGLIFEGQLHHSHSLCRETRKEKKKGVI